MLKFRTFPRSLFVRSFSMGKPYTPEDWELRVADDEKKSVSTLQTEKFTKSFQDYLDSRLTLDDMLKTEEIIRIANMKLDGRMFYSEEDGVWHKR